MGRVRYFIEPYDVLVLRGNKLFGEPGSYGESVVPPWPSVAAGAFRSALLAARGYDPAAFARGEIAHDPELGTPQRPGTFTVSSFGLARRRADDEGAIEALHPVPADLAVHATDIGEAHARRISPVVAANGIQSSTATSRHAVLAQPKRGKLAHGGWLNADAWCEHLAGRDIDTQRHLIPSEELFAVENRIGISLDPRRRRAEDGALFTTQAVALRKSQGTTGSRGGVGGRSDSAQFDVGFLAEIDGVAEDAMPDTLTLRFGGDGRAARATKVAVDTGHHADRDATHRAIAEAGRCRLILTSPGIFASGWLPTGASRETDGGMRFELHGVAGQLVCAVVPRAEVVSGFDLAKRRPKSAQRVAPSGSVYWLNNFQTSPEALRNLATRGLWSEPAENASRRAEGFNRFAFALWRD